MSVSDHGLETLRKSAEQLVPGNKSDTFFKVSEAFDLKAGAFGAISVTTSALLASVTGTNHTARRFLLLYPTDGDIFWGFDNTVTTSSGMKIQQDDAAILKVTDSDNIFVISVGTVDVRVIESQ